MSQSRDEVTSRERLSEEGQSQSEMWRRREWTRQGQREDDPRHGKE